MSLTIQMEYSYTIKRKHRREVERFLTPKQLCELLQVDQSTVYLWTHTEFIPHYKLGRCVRFVERDVAEWLTKRKLSGRKTMKHEITLTRNTPALEVL